MFEKVSIGVKTFLRDEQLFNTIDGIQKTMLDAQVIIADDGKTSWRKEELYGNLKGLGNIIIRLPFDSGFGKKSNLIANSLTRPYLLVASDDFVFDVAAANGVEKLLYFLEYNPGVDIVSGRVNNRPYEYMLSERAGVVTEHYVSHTLLWNDPYKVDLTANYSLIRSRVFDKVRWDDDVKIGGGEHAAFFLDCKWAGFKTVFVPNVSINEQQIRNTPEYNQYRNRARSPERLCFDRRGIKKYVLADGRVDYDKEQHAFDNQS